MKFVVAGAIALAFCLTTPSAFSQMNGLPTEAGVNPNDHSSKLIISGTREARGPRPVNPESRVISKGPLAPSAADRDAFRDFLRNRNTGLMRLMPREIYGAATTAVIVGAISHVTHTKSVVNIRGGGAYFSFADVTHTYGYGSDIQLAHDMLSSGFVVGESGVLTNLGDVPLSEVTLKDPRASLLANSKAVKTESEWRAERMRLEHGVTIDGALYKSSLPLVVNSTYLLRSITRWSDVLVAFRVVRKDTDGSAIILWKRLRRHWLSVP